MSTTREPRWTMLGAAVTIALLATAAPLLSKGTTQHLDEMGCEEGCCPKYDPNVDCWAQGHWHYNHCNQSCT